MPVGTAVVRKIWSPQMMGVEWPRPGMGVFQARFLVSLHSTGASPRAMPLFEGPRQRGQWTGSGWAVTAETKVRASHRELFRNDRECNLGRMGVVMVDGVGAFLHHEDDLVAGRPYPESRPPGAVEMLLPERRS